jgi:hypothetical protein
MPVRFFGLMVLLALVYSTQAYCAVSPPKMRPYSGIGVFMLSADSDPDHGEPFHLYEEPGISRKGELKGNVASGNDWILGGQKGRTPLIVVARKGSWLRVCYDDAGREAWIDTQNRGVFRTWDQFLKGQATRLLPGLRKQYYQLYQQPERHPLSTLTPKQLFKVLRLENDWVMLVSDQNTIGWLRWRDEDGRLLVGIASNPTP